jgi:uncharacterized membrane protein (UPF0136 family)
MWLDAVVVIYGLMQIAFGIEASSKSSISLIAGTFLGLLCIVGAVVAKKRPAIGYGMAIVAALLALGRFAPALAKEPGIYPQGIEVVTSVAVLLSIVYWFYKRRNSI